MQHDFSHRLLTWFELHGRHDLPWQYHHKDSSDIYAVWLSEIMLQQTQVKTVLDYFPRFIKAFPTVQDLACADWDDVAHLWAGLGYYARARNLHKGAKQVTDFIHKNGNFPNTLADWQAISGVGRSTAGAIMAMGVRQRGVICDGNVKRVLTRYFAIKDDITKSATDKVLWELAETLTPTQNSGKFAQAMMDLGATICTRSRPDCTHCPLSSDCQAHRHGNPTDYPIKTKKTAKPHRHSLVFALYYQDKILWIKRTSGTGLGIWDGLYALPMLMTGDFVGSSFSDLNHAKHCHDHYPNAQKLNLSETQIFETLPNMDLHIHKSIKHTLTHFHWQLSLVNVQADDDLYHQINKVLTHINAEFLWQKDYQGLGVPRAMEKLFE